MPRSTRSDCITGEGIGFELDEREPSIFVDADF